MKIVDANVLLAAVNENDRHHRVASAWMERALSRNEAVGFTWIALLAFMRIATRRDVFRTPLSIAQAGEVVERWLSEPAAVEVHPTDRHLHVLRGLLEELGVGGNLVNDAHLAALALEHGGEIVSFDSDFARFHGVRSGPPV